MPLFSIIVPIYNVEKYLRECVDSILTQSFTDFELILVDDGSPDNCPKICDEYAKQDNRVKVIHKENGGLVSTRKAGAKTAKGEYILCIDSDDWISNDYLKVFAEYIKKDNSDIICCGFVWSYKDKDINLPIKITPGKYNKNLIIKDLYPVLIESEKGEYFPPTICAKAFKSELYIKNQLYVDNKIKIGEDHACTKPCVYYANSITIIKDCMYYYRQNDESMTKIGKAFSWSGPELISKHFENHIPMNEYDFQEQVYRATVHNLFNVCASQFNRKEKYSLIKKDILKHISDPYYQNAINSCKYSKKAYKNRLALFALRHKLVYLMKIYNEVK